MAGLIEYYLEQIPEGCHDCPVIVAAIDNLERSQAVGTGIAKADVRFEAEFDSGINPAFHDMFAIIREGLSEVSSEHEFSALDMLASACAEAQGCKGSRRGGYDYEPLSRKLSKFIKNERSCRRPK